MLLLDLFYLESSALMVYIWEGADFRFFWENWYVLCRVLIWQIYAEKNKHVLEKNKKKLMVKFLLNLLLNFDFLKFHTCKVKKWKSSEFNVLKRIVWIHWSQIWREKEKILTYLTDLIAKNLFLKDWLFSLKKKDFIAIHFVKFQ